MSQFKAHRHALLAVLVMVALILFESFQQNFYITRYNLAQEEFSIWLLIGNHFVRWLVWLICALPFFRYVRSRAQEQQQASNILPYTAFILLTVIAGVATIAAYSLVQNAMTFSPENVLETFEFFTYQKGPIFTLALVFAAVYIHLYYRNRELVMEIKSMSTLKQSDQKLYDQFKSQELADNSRLISVKTGKKVNLIPLETIVWIESDNYCVKIHTREGKSFTLRSTMNKMEHVLDESEFLRVHRTAIININELAELSTGKPAYLSLKNGVKLDVASSRLPDIRRILDELNVNSLSVA